MGNYQRSILPGDVPTLSVEASAAHGWHRFSHAHIALTTFGMSGKGSNVMEHFGFSVDNVMKQALTLHRFYNGHQTKKKHPLPNLSTRLELEQLMKEESVAGGVKAMNG